MEKINYEQAIEELETIVSKMESGELNLDAITEKLKRAQKLIKLCKDRLTKTDEEIKKILSSEWRKHGKCSVFRASTGA